MTNKKDLLKQIVIEQKEEDSFVKECSKATEEKCGCCDQEPASSLHFCPLKECKDADNDFMCNCCEECTHQCWEAT